MSTSDSLHSDEGDTGGGVLIPTPPISSPASLSPEYESVSTLGVYHQDLYTSLAASNSGAHISSLEPTSDSDISPTAVSAWIGSSSPALHITDFETEEVIDLAEASYNSGEGVVTGHLAHGSSGIMESNTASTSLPDPAPVAAVTMIVEAGHQTGPYDLPIPPGWTLPLSTGIDVESDPIVELPEELDLDPFDSDNEDPDFDGNDEVLLHLPAIQQFDFPFNIAIQPQNISNPGTIDGAEDEPDLALGDAITWTGPMNLAGLTPMHVELSANFSFCQFAMHWRRWHLMQKPGIPEISMFAEEYRLQQRPDIIDRTTMARTKCDFQGIHWPRYKVNKADARKLRGKTYRNFRNMDLKKELVQPVARWGTDGFKINFTCQGTSYIQKKEKYFRFQEAWTRHIPQTKHYQLRHNISAPSQNEVYYHHGKSFAPYFVSPPAPTWTVECYNPVARQSRKIAEYHDGFNAQEGRCEAISTLSADHDMLIVGTISGIYGLQSLRTEYDKREMVIKQIAPSRTLQIDMDNSTNHVHSILCRQSGQPHAIFSSNDDYIRILDCTTNTWLNKFNYASPVNCSCTDPSGRLRLLVSDDPTPVIADAETGHRIAELTGHSDHGFACAWAPDGVTFATGYQDGLVQVWDVRKLSGSLARIPSHQSAVRCMQFTPLGCGKPALILGEAADYVHIVNADTFASQQTIEFFGEIAGLSLTPDGQTLYVGNADPDVGGLIRYRRVHAPPGPTEYERTEQTRNFCDSSALLYIPDQGTGPDTDRQPAFDLPLSASKDGHDSESDTDSHCRAFKKRVRHIPKYSASLNPLARFLGPFAPSKCQKRRHAGLDPTTWRKEAPVPVLTDRGWTSDWRMLVSDMKIGHADWVGAPELDARADCAVGRKRREAFGLGLDELMV